MAGVEGRVAVVTGSVAGTKTVLEAQAPAFSVQEAEAIAGRRSTSRLPLTRWRASGIRTSNCAPKTAASGFSRSRTLPRIRRCWTCRPRRCCTSLRSTRAWPFPGSGRLPTAPLFHEVDTARRAAFHRRGCSATCRANYWVMRRYTRRSGAMSGPWPRAWPAPCVASFIRRLDTNSSGISPRRLGFASDTHHCIADPGRRLVVEEVLDHSRCRGSSTARRGCARRSSTMTSVG